MESKQFLGWNKNASYWQNLEEEGDEGKGAAIIMPLIPPQPQTPKEPMDFLSRSWSLSATELSKALAHKHKQCSFDKYPDVIPETVITNQISGKVLNPVTGQRTRAIGRWFHHKNSSTSTTKKKDKARIESAHIHAALSVAGLAAGLAAVAATENSKASGSKMSMALASATELLASHCVELAESAGADYERVASVVRSAVDIRSSSDLVTLTAAAATALRGEAALKARLPKESKRNAAITPCDKSMIEAQVAATFHDEVEERDPPCVGDLLQHTQKGVHRWKHVSVYINKESQVIMKLKSKHVGGAFSKKNKCVVYEVCDETFKKEKANPEVYFGLKTARGLLEFKCKNKIHRQKWVDGIQNLLNQNSGIEEAERSLKFLSINKSI